MIVHRLVLRIPAVRFVANHLPFFGYDHWQKNTITPSYVAQTNG